MSVALLGALLLLLGSLKVFLWINQRTITRQIAYEDTRVAAGDDQPGRWEDQASSIRLRIFR